MRFENLDYEEISNTDDMEILPYTRLGTLNSKSVKSKDNIIWMNYKIRK